MRSAAKLLLQQAGALQQATSAQAAAPALPQLVRQMAGPAGGAHQESPTTPLSSILPSLVTIPRQVVTTAFSLTGKLVVGAATSGAAKSVVSSFANKLVMEEALVKVQDLDPAYWAYWLSAVGYSNTAAYKKLVEAAKAKVAGMDADQISNLVTGLHTAFCYDKELFDGIAKNISANFTRFDTEQMLKIVTAFAQYDHYSTELFDDIADSITYANHYLAPIKVPTSEVAAGLAAFAKFKHERADCFLTLARGISEVGLSKLDAATRRTTVVSALRALDSFGFYPEQVDALLYYANAEADSYTADETKDVQRIQAAVEVQAGGKLATYVPNHAEDSVHWYGHHHHAPSRYDLYVFRDSLVPKSYIPSTMRIK